MAVIIGSARINENGKARGGKAGDQRGGREVSTQNWYKHSKGWRVFRAKDAAAREKIAQTMQWACDTNLIGYDQGERNTLYNAVKNAGFDVRKLDKPVETDCSALVRVCAAYAGIMLPDFYTANEPSVLLNSGAFVEMTGSSYTEKSDYLLRGDILVTRTKGHTVVVLSDGSKAGVPNNKRMTLHKGDSGEDVKELQNILLSLGYRLPKYGADGEYGAETISAVKAFQKGLGLEIDGICGPKTWAALETAKNALKPAVLEIVSAIQRTLRNGSAGYDVMALQTALIYLGYKLPKYGQDGDYGEETLTAVKQFQQDYGLSVDAILGPKSLEKLKEVIAL